MEITREIAEKVLQVVDAGLVKGVGKPKPGQMCVEAAVCYAMGLPHGDEPSCVSPALRAFKIRLNDASWSSNTARAAGLRRLALAQLGSAGALNEKEFIAKLIYWIVGKIVPATLRRAARVQISELHRGTLEKAALDCEQNRTRYSALAVLNVTRNAAYAAADAAAAAYAAAYAAADAATAATADAARDKALGDAAEDVVQILIEMNAPGVQWLDLAPLAT